MATFPASVSAATTANTIPANASLQGQNIDPSLIYVSVRVPGTLIRPDPNNGAAGAYGADTYYRLSDLINYIVATAKGQ